MSSERPVDVPARDMGMAHARIAGITDPSWFGHDDQSWALQVGVNGWYVINYDILRDYPEIKSGKPWDLLILDESHKLKNPEAIRTQQVFGGDSDPSREGVAVDRNTDDKLRPRVVYPVALPRSGDVAIV